MNRSSFLLVCLSSLLFVRPGFSQELITCKRVIDGDTIVLSDRTVVRLIGIDAPESYDSEKLERDSRRSNRDKAAIQQLGKLSAIYARSLCLGKPVFLVYDLVNVAINHKDKYGRTLAYVYVPGHGPVSVNELMIASGHAKAYTVFPFGKAQRFIHLDREARRMNLGLWNISN